MTQNFFYKQHTLPNLIAEEKTPPQPSMIGPYKIESLLSKGGMSYLYLGLHPDSHQPLAVKILSPDFVSDETAAQRFLQEAHIISLSNHPNIVKLYGEGKWEGGLYIAMEWIRGISLRQFIAQQSLSLRRALDVILQVAYALHHLHSHGIIHRDLKPENILITEDGAIKVIDFGIAQLHHEKAEKSPPVKQGVLGTPNYMSPEQREDASKASFASDIYSLGIISYELILGKLSYGLINLSLLPKELRKIIEKALAVSKSERYQTITDFINDISRYLTSGEIEKERPGKDQIKEWIEDLQILSQHLSPQIPYDWPQVEVGIAKNANATQLNLYFDFYKLPNNNYLFLTSEVTIERTSSLALIANFRGFVRSALHSYLAGQKTPFRLPEFVQTLQTLVQADPLKTHYAFGCLLLDPLQDQLTFINAGADDLLHVSIEGTPRILSSSNPLLGKELNPEFSEVVDNWSIGDTLILPLVFPSYRTEKEQHQIMQETLLSAGLQESLLSAQPQAEAIFRTLSQYSTPSALKYARVVLSIQRVS